MAENKTLEHLPEVRAAVAALSPEDREVLAAVQTSPFKLTTPEQFKEFAANIDYFVWNHDRPAEPEKKPSIRERLEQGKKECAEKNKAQPHKEKSAPEL